MESEIRNYEEECVPLEKRMLSGRRLKEIMPKLYEEADIFNI